MYIEENYKEYGHSIVAYSEHSTRSRCRLDYINYIIQPTNLVESLEYAPIL